MVARCAPRPRRRPPRRRSPGPTVVGGRVRSRATAEPEPRGTARSPPQTTSAEEAFAPISLPAAEEDERTCRSPQGARCSSDATRAIARSESSSGARMDRLRPSATGAPYVALILVLASASALLVGIVVDDGAPSGCPSSPRSRRSSCVDRVDRIRPGAA